MADKLIVVKDNGVCELATLKAYPVVQGSGESTVTSSVNSSGAVVYTVNSKPSVVTKAVTGHVIATHTSGTNVSTAIEETVTTLVRSGAGFTYTNEAGQVTTITLCQMAHDIADNGAIIGG